MHKYYAVGRLYATDDLYFKVLGGALQTSNIGDTVSFLYGVGVGAKFKVNKNFSIIGEAAIEKTTLENHAGKNITLVPVSFGCRWAF
jgi:hypothetical protein